MHMILAPARRALARGLACLTVGVLTAGVLGCSAPDPLPEARALESSGLLPMAIHEMPLVAVRVGTDAEAFIDDLHGGGVAPLSSYVGRYQGGGARATLYVSRVAEPSVADSLVARMSRSIGRGTRMFAHHTSFRVQDVDVHVVLGEGQIHFFYARGPVVTWLAIDRAMARVGLADLLGLDMTRVPSGVVVGGVDVLPPPDSLYHRQPASAPPFITPSTRSGGSP